MKEKQNSIIECVFDIHFELKSGSIDDILNIFRKDNAPVDFEKLSNITKGDPTYIYKPIYIKKGNGYNLLVGERSIGIALEGIYTGWSEGFLPHIQDLVKKIENNDIFGSIKRIGLRYVDFLPDTNIFESGKICININDKNMKNAGIFFSVNDENNGEGYIITITKINKDNKFVGSMVDITTYSKRVVCFDDIVNIANQIHTLNKEKFKEVISDEQCKKLGI